MIRSLALLTLAACGCPHVHPPPSRDVVGQPYAALLRASAVVAQAHADAALRPAPCVAGAVGAAAMRSAASVLGSDAPVVPAVSVDLRACGEVDPVDVPAALDAVLAVVLAVAPAVLDAEKGCEARERTGAAIQHLRLVVPAVLAAVRSGEVVVEVPAVPIASCDTDTDGGAS